MLQWRHRRITRIMIVTGWRSLDTQAYLDGHAAWWHRDDGARRWVDYAVGGPAQPLRLWRCTWKLTLSKILGSATEQYLLFHVIVHHLVHLCCDGDRQGTWSLCTGWKWSCQLEIMEVDTLRRTLSLIGVSSPEPPDPLYGMERA